MTVGLLAIYAPHAMAAPSLGDQDGAGERKGATRLKFQAGDSVLAQVDVGSGNLLVSVKTLPLVGAKGSTVQTGAYYNSALADDLPKTERLGAGWAMDLTPMVKLKPYDGGVTYIGPGGLTVNFDLVAGSATSYTQPKGLDVTLTRLSDGGEWEMKDHKSGEVSHFTTTGALRQRSDRDGNNVDIAELSTSTGGYKDLQVTTPAGPTGARTEKITTASNWITTLSQKVSGTSRSVSFNRNSGLMESFIDALGRETTFSYDSKARLTKINAPGSVSTKFTYADATSGRVASVSQVEDASGGPGTSVTRLDYPSTDTTYVADPTTDQAQAVSAVPHTTYTLDGSDRVTKAEDPEGRTRQKSYTPFFDTLTASAGTGKAAGNTFAANGGESLTKSSSASKAAVSLSYPSATNGTQYLPTSSKDAAGNSSTYTYSGSGNMLSSKNAALAATANLDYNADGTIKVAKKPDVDGDTSSITSYAYNADHQMESVTPPPGSTLGVRAFTYDEFGRQKTATNGRGITQTSTYDKADRLAAVKFSDGLTVSYGYDAAGRLTTRTDPNGTTTYTYDQLGRLTKRKNTAGGGTFTYKYDKASRLVSSASTAGGTVSYTYDKAGAVASITYPDGKGGTGMSIFKTDDHGRRTDTWFNTNADKSLWAGHMKISYDDDDRVTETFVEENYGPAIKRAYDTTYCYQAATPNYVDCKGGIPVAKVQWKLDLVATDQYVHYTYDAGGRLTDAIIENHKNFNYAYDKRGNRTDADAQHLAFNTDNQIKTAGYTYDAAGNLTAKPDLTSIAYTSADQVKSVVKNGVTYTYQHAGADQNELLAQTTPDGNYTYAYGRNDAQGKPTLESLTRDGKTVNVINDPVTGQPLFLRVSTGLPEMYVPDGVNGTPVAIINSDGQRSYYNDADDPYGTPSLRSTEEDDPALVESPFEFAQGIIDRTTNWVHFGNRYFDPTIGTWTQMDTLDAPLDPKNANRYAYAGDDPINNIDPLGRDTANIAGNIFGAFVGGLIGVPLAVVNPFVGGAVGGCVGVSLGNGYEAAWRGQSSTVVGLGVDCLTGALLFGGGFGIKKVLGFS